MTYLVARDSDCSRKQVGRGLGKVRHSTCKVRARRVQRNLSAALEAAAGHVCPVGCSFAAYMQWSEEQIRRRSLQGSDIISQLDLFSPLAPAGTAVQFASQPLKEMSRSAKPQGVAALLELSRRLDRFSM